MLLHVLMFVLRSSLLSATDAAGCAVDADYDVAVYVWLLMMLLARVIAEVATLMLWLLVLLACSCR